MSGPDEADHLLASVLSAAKVPAPGAWHPVPAVDDRAFWEAIDPATRQVLVDEAERLATDEWPALPASLWLDFRRTGNRVRFQDPYFARRRRLSSAVLAACLTDDDRWYDEVVDGISLICEETSWCLPAHDESNGRRGLGLPRPDNPTLDLFAAETGALLAWTDAVLWPRLEDPSSGLVARLVHEVRTRVLIPQRTVDTWVWFGRQGHVNNWNPWINANVLACSLLLDPDHDDIARTVERAVFGLDRFMGGYPADGACDEGHLYWWRAGASLSECLEVLRAASDGGLDGFDLPLVREIGRYLHRMHIDGDWYVNVADGSARLDPENACPHVLYRFGKRVGDADMVRHALAMRDAGPVVAAGVPLGRSLLALADQEWRAEAPATAPLVREAWWPQTQLLVARQTAGSSDGLFVSVKGGHNGEDHNHNDVGTFLVALDGHPVLVDAGVAEYTARHFSPQRYEIWSLRSAYHNVPLVNGFEQSPGRDHAAGEMSAVLRDSDVRFEIELAPAYPDEAGILQWLRSVALDRDAGAIVVDDRWSFDEAPGDVRLHLLASAEPSADGETALRIPTPGRALRVAFGPQPIDVEVERIDLDDRRLRSVWGAHLWRIALVVRDPASTGAVALELTPERV